MNILHVMGGASTGGIAAVVLNYLKFINSADFHFDIALCGHKPGLLGEELMKLGAQFYQLPMKSNGIKQFETSLELVLREKQYDAVHVHSGDTAYVALRVAKKCKIKKRLAHSHNAKMVDGLYGNLRLIASEILNPYYATDLIACGKLAGICAYGRVNTLRKNYTVLPNAIDTSRFSFNKIVRDTIHIEEGIENRFVVGMVGRLSYQKNYPFALEVIESLHRIMPNVILLIIGIGEEENRIQDIIYKKRMESYVRLLGQKSKVEEYYSAFDVLLMPSLYEGFPVVAVEAMASGLPVYVSNTITDELSFGSAVHYLPLSNPREWAYEIYKNTEEVRLVERQIRQSEVKINGLDIRDTVKRLEAIYRGNY